jgi:hypothetical protein
MQCAFAHAVACSIHRRGHRAEAISAHHREITAAPLPTLRLEPPSRGVDVLSLDQATALRTLALADGRGVKGFLVEAAAVEGGRDISRFASAPTWPRQSSQSRPIHE